MQNNIDPFAESAEFDFEESDVELKESGSITESQPTFGSRTAVEQSWQQITPLLISWKSKDKAFVCYNTETKETKPVPAAVEFIPLTTTVSVTGSRPMGKKGTPSEHYNTIHSNEVRNINDDLMIVKERDLFEDTDNVLFRGTYAGSVKEAIKDLPYANFTLNVYCLIKGKNDIARISFTKASRSTGFEIARDSGAMKGNGKSFHLKEAQEQGNGGITYYTPVLEYTDLTDEEAKAATEATETVEEKLKNNAKLVK